MSWKCSFSWGHSSYSLCYIHILIYFTFLYLKINSLSCSLGEATSWNRNIYTSTGKTYVFRGYHALFWYFFQSTARIVNLFLIQTNVQTKRCAKLSRLDLSLVWSNFLYVQFIFVQAYYVRLNIYTMYQLQDQFCTLYFNYIIKSINGEQLFNLGLIRVFFYLTNVKK